MNVWTRNLQKSYHNLCVIRDMDIEFSEDGINCIFGPSGCGKTTLLNIITGLTPYDGGRIGGIGDKTISYIFQEDRLLPWATVEENIMLVLEGRYAKSEARKVIDKYLALVKLENFHNSYPDHLSGGMKRRVAIARALAYEGEMLIMDEPFKGLDLELKRALMAAIMEYWLEKKPFFIFVTHDPEEVLSMADYVHIFSGPALALERKITIDIPQNNRKDNNFKLKKYKEALLGLN